MGKIENATIAAKIGGELLPWAVSDYSSESTGTVEVRLVPDEGSHGYMYIMCHNEQQVIVIDHYTGEDIAVRPYSDYL